MSKTLNDSELRQIKLLLLNISQDIRFAAEFRMKNHKILKTHLLITHKDLVKIRKIIWGE